MTFVAEGFKKYVNRPEHTFDIVGSFDGVPNKLREYDFTLAFFTWNQSTYANKVFEEIKHKYVPMITGLFCYRRLKDWSIFDHVFVVSDSVAVEDRLNTEYSVMPFGVDAEKFHPMDIKKKWFAAYIGNLNRDPQKRVKAWMIPICKEAEVDLYVHDGISNFLPDEEIVKMHNQCHVHLMTSKWDGGPRPILEAASCGIPLLATPTGFATHGLVQDGLNGWFCNTKDDFVYRINQMKNSPTIMKYMGEASRRIVLRDWDWRVVAEQWMRKLEELW
jgi:hypothetical protein